MECGGKRSATPLWNLLSGQSKAPSQLRFAGALQIVSEGETHAYENFYQSKFVAFVFSYFGADHTVAE
jgi:hypothetical protein